jgi:hypothetical protein
LAWIPLPYCAASPETLKYLQKVAINHSISSISESISLFQHKKATKLANIIWKVAFGYPKIVWVSTDEDRRVSGVIRYLWVPTDKDKKVIRSTPSDDLRFFQIRNI